MELTNEILDDINKYLSKKMSVEEQQRFESDLASNQELRQEVEIQSEIKMGFKQHELNLQNRENLKANFQSIHAKFREEGRLVTQLHEAQETNNEKDNVIGFEPKKEGNLWSKMTALKPSLYYGMAASIAIFIGIWWFSGQDSRQNQEYYSSYFKEKPIDIDPELMGSVSPELMGSVSKETEEKDFNKLTEGIKNLNNGQIKEAIAKFEALSNAKSSYWSSVAQWYLSMAFLKDNQREKAIEQLKSIVAEKDHAYQKDAEKLLKEME